MNARYPKYKDSGVEWLGQVPEHWEVKPLFATMFERQEKNEGNKVQQVLSLSYGQIVPRDVENNFGLLPESFETYQIVLPENIILRLTDLQNDKRSLRVGMVQQKGIITSAYVCLQALQVLAAEFVYYLLHSYDLSKVFYGLGGGVRQTMKFSDLKRLPLLIPPLDEQRAIAAFLDRETARLDTLIARQQRLIELSLEKRRALIGHAVTRGLDENAPRKDSGVEWLGDVPEHWDVKRLKNSVEFERNGIWGNEPCEDENDLVCVRVADFDRHNLEVGLQKLTLRNITESEQNGRVLEKGDLLLEKSGGGDSQPVGCVVLFDHDFKAVCSNFIARLKMSPNVDSNFFVYVHAALYDARINVRSIKQTTGIQNLGSQSYFEERVAFPPLDEQRAICRYLQNETAKIDTLIAKARHAIELMKEHRSALIAAAVTGHIDVRATVGACGGTPKTGTP